MTTITLKLPETAFAVLRKSPAEFAQAMKIAALVKWYEQGLVSQSKAAEIAGVSRQEFLEQLFVHHTSPYQLDAGELEDELE
jgi:predicted HTH domain antitoxin